VSPYLIGGKALVAKNRLFTVLGVIAKDIEVGGPFAKPVAKKNCNVGFCRQASPRVQNIKKHWVRATPSVCVLCEKGEKGEKKRRLGIVFGHV
jgi:hypothetical protein